MSKPIVAIVGRPNVGKSTLFNKLIGERRSIVEDTPGVTRDRIYGTCEWCGREMIIVDTGGIEPKTDDTILKQMRYQAQLAIESADVIMRAMSALVSISGEMLLSSSTPQAARFIVNWKVMNFLIDLKIVLP